MKWSAKIKVLVWLKNKAEWRHVESFLALQMLYVYSILFLTLIGSNNLIFPK